MFKKNAKPLLLPIALAASLMGCATRYTPSATPQNPPTIPQPPVELMQEPSSASYSDSVQRLLLEWRERLIAWQRRS